MNQTEYDTAYKAAIPANIVEVMNMPMSNSQEITARQNAFVALAQNGYIIDNDIMVWGWDPFTTMSLRVQYGYTWVPSLLQSNIQEAPGISSPGLIPYNSANPPAGSIIISNFWPTPPPPIQPAQPPAAPTTLSLGISMAPNFPGYYQMVNDSSSIPVGTDIVLNGHTYVKQVLSVTPFGTLYGWKEIS